MKKRAKQEQTDKITNWEHYSSAVFNALLDISVLLVPSKYKNHAKFVVAIFAVLFIIVNSIFQSVTTIWDAVMPREGSQIVLGESTEPFIYSDFQDKENWTNLDKFKIESEDPLIISLGQESRGNVAFYKKNLSSKFATSFKFIPKSEIKTNVIFQFDGLYRVVIGDGDNKSIKFEQNLDPASVPAQWTPIKDLERSKEKRFIGGAGFLPDNEVEFKLTSLPLDDQTLKIEVVLTYAPPVNNLGGAKQTAKYEYVIKTINPTSSIVGRLGVGLLDDSLSGEIKVQPIEISAEKYDLK